MMTSRWLLKLLFHRTETLPSSPRPPRPPPICGGRCSARSSSKKSHERTGLHARDPLVYFTGLRSLPGWVRATRSPNISSTAPRAPCALCELGESCSTPMSPGETCNGEAG